MKLIDLEPRWYTFSDAPGNARCGLTFLCPHCKEHRLGVAFHHQGHEVMEDTVIRAKSPSTDHIWTLIGSEDFGTLSLTPSVDASGVGHWHGYIINGECTP